MRATTLGHAALAVLAAAGWAAADGDEPGKAVAFAEPVRLKAGEKWLGEGRYYPSPVMHDLDRDGKAEVLVGDLRGVVTFATRTAAGLGPEAPLLTRDQTPLKFDNW